MREEHVHAYVTSRLREAEVPRNPAYREGDKVLVCTVCGLLCFGNPWVDRAPRYREPGDTF